jgi:hypothetical protein
LRYTPQLCSEFPERKIQYPVLTVTGKEAQYNHAIECQPFRFANSLLEAL